MALRNCLIRVKKRIVVIFANESYEKIYSGATCNNATVSKRKVRHVADNKRLLPTRAYGAAYLSCAP